MNASYLEKQQDRTVALLHKNKLLDFKLHGPTFWDQLSFSVFSTAAKQCRAHERGSPTGDKVPPDARET
jgi:hypothetical protein